MSKTFTPRETASLLGVSESSVKRWVDRQRIRADRTAGGHRRIPLAELVRFVREEGMPVMRPELLGVEPVGSGAADSREAGQASAGEAFRQALVDGAPDRARSRVLEEYLAGRSVAHIIDEMVAPSLRAVGELWQCRDDGIFLEHRAVGICEEALEALRTLLFRPEAGAPVAVGGGPGEDPYTLPSRMAATVLLAEGWATTDLGAFTPAGVLAEAAVVEGAELVWLAVSSARGPEAVRGLARELTEHLAAVDWHGAVAVGGPACRELGVALPGTTRLVPSMAELAAFARGLSGPRAPEAVGPGGGH